jgi:glycine cleavage system transcriptional repressor
MPNDHFLVLSALGPDRPGLVADITHYLTERGANIEDSRMATLGGEFGVMILVSGPEVALDRIARELGELERKTDAGVVVKRTLGPVGRGQPEAERTPAVLIAEALDHEGIVRAVALALSRLGVNIASMETAAYNAPETGSTLFRLEAQLELPRGLSIDELRQAMLEVARTENLDLTIQDGVVPGKNSNAR